VVKGLWDCWEDGALVADKASGVYIDDSKIRPLDHKGRFFQVKGPMSIARCPQGHPVIIEAGGSPAGLELAARTADVVFSVVQERDSAKKAYADLKGRMPKYGRSPEQLSVLPGVMPIIGASEAEAKEKLDRLQSWLTLTNALILVTGRIGYDVSGYPLDGPVPPPAPSEGVRTFHRVLYDMARRQNMTLRDLYNLTAAARAHWVICGTPTGIADTLEEWFVGRAADGYNILPPNSRRIRRFCRPGRAGTPAPRPLPPRLRGPDVARPSRLARWRRRRGCAKPPGPNNDDRNLDATACKTRVKRMATDSCLPRSSRGGTPT
jgi:N-acetyl-S-(2-succino)cysteine monooxygenase